MNQLRRRQVANRKKVTMIRRIAYRSALLGAMMAALLTAPGAHADRVPVDSPSAVAATGQLLRDGTGLYPRAVRLQHSGAANGRTLASVVTFVGNADGVGAIYESSNGAGAFVQVGAVADPLSAGGKGALLRDVVRTSAASRLDARRNAAAGRLGGRTPGRWRCGSGS